MMPLQNVCIVNNRQCSKLNSQKSRPSVTSAKWQI